MAWLAGYPRDQIPWYPTVPDVQIVRDIYKREGIWSKVKRQLREEGKLEIQARRALGMAGAGCEEGDAGDTGPGGSGR